MLLMIPGGGGEGRGLVTGQLPHWAQQAWYLGPTILLGAQDNVLCCLKFRRKKITFKSKEMFSYIILIDLSFHQGHSKIQFLSLMRKRAHDDKSDCTHESQKCGAGRGALDSLPASPLKNRSTTGPAWLSNAFGINQEHKSGNSGLKEKTELQPAPHPRVHLVEESWQRWPNRTCGAFPGQGFPLVSTKAPLWST